MFISKLCHFSMGHETLNQLDATKSDSCKVPGGNRLLERAYIHDTHPVIWCGRLVIFWEWAPYGNTEKLEQTQRESADLLGCGPSWPKCSAQGLVTKKHGPVTPKRATYFCFMMYSFLLERQDYKEKEKQRSAGFIPKCPHWPELSLSKARIQVGAGVYAWTICHCFPRSGRWFRK